MEGSDPAHRIQEYAERDPGSSDMDVILVDLEHLQPPSKPENPLTSIGLANPTLPRSLTLDVRISPDSCRLQRFPKWAMGLSDSMDTCQTLDLPQDASTQVRHH